jgi:hypothetical protein
VLRKTLKIVEKGLKMLKEPKVPIVKCAKGADKVPRC